MTCRRVLADGVYAPFIPSFRQLSELTGRWPGPVRRVLSAVGPLRAIVMAAAGVRYDALAVFRTGRGWRSTLLLRAALGRRRKLVVLHFIDHPPRDAGVGRVVDLLWRPVDRWATRRAVLRAQVLSPRERRLYAAAFGVEEERFCLIPFAWRMSQAPPRPASSRQLVLSAGRALCDWPTLFAAARRGSWPLVVVCGEHDRAVVDRLNAGGRATVMSELSQSQMSELLLEAAICVLALRDSPISHGQIRLCNAVDAGAAVVASAVSSLDGYVEDGRTALLVPPGDPEALAATIDRLAGDPELRDRLARAAFERASAWTAADYIRAVEAFVLHGTEPNLPPSFLADDTSRYRTRRARGV